MKESCIRDQDFPGPQPQLVKEEPSIALTAPSPSKTAPKQSAAMMIHMNMQLTPSVLASELVTHAPRDGHTAAQDPGRHASPPMPPTAALSTSDW